MPSELTCPHCLHVIRCASDQRDMPPCCPTCGKAFQVAKGAGTVRIRRGMNARQDDDYYEDDDADLEDRPSRRRRSSQRPGKVQAIAVMTLIGGILACLVGLHWVVAWGAATMGLCCLWPGGYYSLVIGILGIIKGSNLLGKDAHLLPPPKGMAVMMIINIVNGDVANLVMGIIILVFLNDPEVEGWYQS